MTLTVVLALGQSVIHTLKLDAKNCHNLTTQQAVLSQQPHRPHLSLCNNVTLHKPTNTCQ
jgi:hypothetical protein